MKTDKYYYRYVGCKVHGIFYGKLEQLVFTWKNTADEKSLFHFENEFLERILECLNACDGMVDPRKEVKQLKRLGRKVTKDCGELLDHAVLGHDRVCCCKWCEIKKGKKWNFDVLSK